MRLSVAISATQSVVLFLTVRKHFSVFRAGWGRTRLAQLMMRDGTCMYVAIFGAFPFVCGHLKADSSMTTATLLVSGGYLKFNSDIAFSLC